MSNALMLIGTTGDRPAHLIYGQETGDHRPFILLTVTPGYVAHKISKTLPIDPKEPALFIHDYADDLMKLAVTGHDGGKTGTILTATLPEVAEPHLRNGSRQRTAKSCRCSSGGR
jgi:hypothetical protein